MLYPLISYVHKNIGFQCQIIFLYLCIDFFRNRDKSLDLTIKKIVMLFNEKVFWFFSMQRLAVVIIWHWSVYVSIIRLSLENILAHNFLFFSEEYRPIDFYCTQYIILVSTKTMRERCRKTLLFYFCLQYFYVLIGNKYYYI